MKVQVRVLVTPKQVIQNRTFNLELPGPVPVADLLRMLPFREDERWQLFQCNGGEILLNQGLAVLINGENITLRNGLQTLVSDGDRVSVIHALSGG